MRSLTITVGLLFQIRNFPVLPKERINKNRLFPLPSLCLFECRVWRVCRVVTKVSISQIFAHFPLIFTIFHIFFANFSPAVEAYYCYFLLGHIRPNFHMHFWTNSCTLLHALACSCTLLHTLALSQHCLNRFIIIKDAYFLHKVLHETHLNGKKCQKMSKNAKKCQV